MSGLKNKNHIGNIQDYWQFYKLAAPELSFIAGSEFFGTRAQN